MQTFPKIFQTGFFFHENLSSNSITTSALQLVEGPKRKENKRIHTHTAAAATMKNAQTQTSTVPVETLYEANGHMHSSSCQLEKVHLKSCYWILFYILRSCLGIFLSQLHQHFHCLFF